jgi:hypothetical protein
MRSCHRDRVGCDQRAQEPHGAEAVLPAIGNGLGEKTRVTYLSAHVGRG